MPGKGTKERLLPADELDDYPLVSTHGEGDVAKEDEEDEEAKASSTSYKSSSPIRWGVLALSVLVLIGPYYAYDNPAATEVALRSYFGVPAVANENSTSAENATYTQFNVDFQLLYSTYSVPNTVWPVAAGALVDGIGARSSNILSTSISLGGHALVAAGIATQSWYVSWTGRAVFGIGTELMCVSSRMLVAEWFLGGGGEVALAMGVLLATGRLSSVVNDAISGLFDGTHVAQAYYVGVGACALSVIAAIIAFLVDRQYEANVAANTGAALAASGGDRHRQRNGGGGRGGGGEILSLNRDEERDGGDAEMELDDFTASKERRAKKTKTTPSTPRFSLFSLWTQVRSWRWTFWVLCGLCVTGYCCVVAFNNVAAAFLQARYLAAGQDASEEHVNVAMAILFLSAAVAATFAGSLVDATGCRAAFMLAASTCVATCHFVLSTTSVGTPLPEIMFAIMGTSFAVFAAALWPAVAFVVPKLGLGTAYGLMGAAQNSGLVVTPLLTSYLQPPACGGEYICVCLMYAGIAVAAMGLSLLLVIDEARTARAAAAAEKKGPGKQGNRVESEGFFGSIMALFGFGSSSSSSHNHQLWSEVDAALEESEAVLAGLGQGQGQGRGGHGGGRGGPGVAALSGKKQMGGDTWEAEDDGEDDE